MRNTILKISTIASFVLASLSMSACDFDLSSDNENENKTESPSTKPATKCTDNETKCHNNALFTCTSGAWNAGTDCEFGCDDDGLKCLTSKPDNGTGTGDSGTGTGDSGTGTGDSGTGTGDSGTDSSTPKAGDPCTRDTFVSTCKDGVYTYCDRDSSNNSVVHTFECSGERLTCASLNGKQSCVNVTHGLVNQDGSEYIPKVGDFLQFNCDAYISQADEDGLYPMSYIQIEKADDGELYGFRKYGISVCRGDVKLYCDKFRGANNNNVYYTVCGKSCTEEQTKMDDLDFTIGSCVMPESDEPCTDAGKEYCMESSNGLCYVSHFAGEAVCADTCTSDEDNYATCMNDTLVAKAECTEVGGNKILVYHPEECANQCVEEEFAYNAVCQ